VSSNPISVSVCVVVGEDRGICLRGESRRAPSRLVAVDLVAIVKEVSKPDAVPYA
jgi:hypothetical protein